MRRDSQIGMLAEWSELLKEVRANEADLAGVARYRDALEKTYAEAQDTKSRRDALQASTMDATRRLNKAFAEGRDASIALRSFIRGVLGIRAEKLRRYGIKPLRKRARRSRKRAA
jgi:hypothetical protein